MFSCLIAVLLITAAALSLSIQFKKSFADLLAPVVFGIMILLYGFYIFNRLYLGRSIVIFLLLLASCYPLIRNRSAVSQIKNCLCGHTFMLYLLGIGLFLFFSRNKFVSLYDCLRLWGAYPKLLHTNGMLQLGDQSMLYPVIQSYPPGMPLLCYFFTSFSPSFSESVLFFTYSFFGFSLMLPFLSPVSEQHKKASFLIFLGIIFLPYLVSGMNDDGGLYYSSLFIDIPLGICCGYFFSRAFHPRNKTDLLSATLSCGVLVLLKDSGAFLALCGIAGGLICNLLKKEKQQKKVWLLSVFCQVLLLAFTYGSWKYCLNLYGVVRKVQPSIYIPSVRTLGFLFLHFIKTPVTGILTLTGAIHFSLPAALIILFTAKFLLAKHNPDCQIRCHIADIAVQFLCYAGFFLGYCFSFLDQMENQIYPSFSRYHCTLLICAIYILVYDCIHFHSRYLMAIAQEIRQFIRNSSLSKLMSSAAAVLRLGMIICLVFSVCLILFLFPGKFDNFYVKAKESADLLSGCVSDHATVYLCMSDASDESILIQHRLYFELLDDDIYIPNYLSSIDITENGVDYTCDHFLNHLIENDYDYVMLTDVNDMLISDFAPVFGDISAEETNLIYQVDKIHRQLIRVQ